jgi:hypothetical protein
MLSTGEIPAGHRLEWLRETIRRGYADVEITPPADGNLFNEMRIFPWRKLRLSTIRSRFKRMLSLCSVRAIWYRSASGGMSAFGSVHCSERDSAMRISAPRAHSAATQTASMISCRLGTDVYFARCYCSSLKVAPEVDRPAVLAEEISECLVSELLKVPHAVPGEQVEGIPCLLIELNALAGHCGIVLRANSATL